MRKYQLPFVYLICKHLYFRRCFIFKYSCYKYIYYIDIYLFSFKYTGPNINTLRYFSHIMYIYTLLVIYIYSYFSCWYVFVSKPGQLLYCNSNDLRKGYRWSEWKKKQGPCVFTTWYHTVLYTDTCILAIQFIYLSIYFQLFKQQHGKEIKFLPQTQIF